MGARPCNGVRTSDCSDCSTGVAAGRCYNRRGPGGVAERFKAVVLKTTNRKIRGFESHPLRPKPRPNMEESHSWSSAAAC